MSLTSYMNAVKTANNNKISDLTNENTNINFTIGELNSQITAYNGQITANNTSIATIQADNVKVDDIIVLLNGA